MTSVARKATTGLWNRDTRISIPKGARVNLSETCRTWRLDLRCLVCVLQLCTRPLLSMALHAHFHLHSHDRC